MYDGLNGEHQKKKKKIKILLNLATLPWPVDFSNFGNVWFSQGGNLCKDALFTFNYASKNFPEMFVVHDF